MRGSEHEVALNVWVAIAPALPSAEGCGLRWPGLVVVAAWCTLRECPQLRRPRWHSHPLLDLLVRF